MSAGGSEKVDFEQAIWSAVECLSGRRAGVPPPVMLPLATLRRPKQLPVGRGPGQAQRRTRPPREDGIVRWAEGPGDLPLSQQPYTK